MQRANKSLVLLFFVVLSQMLTGCLRSYAPLYYQASATPVIFEPEQSGRKQEKYVRADLLFADGEHKNESLQMLRLSYFAVNTTDYFNINGRLFGYYGNYNVSGMGEADGSKNAYGIGGEISAKVNLKVQRFKFGVGASLGAASEFGAYYTFRKNGNQRDEIYSPKDWAFLTLSLFPMIAYEFPGQDVLSFQVNLGMPGALSPIVAWNRRGAVYWLSYLNGLDDDNVYYSRLMFGISKKL